MASQSLLGHLVMRLSNHPENVATESLAYILARSAAARRAIIGFIQDLGPKISTNVVFQAQASGAEGSIPDLVGRGAEGDEIIILEAKFEAGLTENQPVGYIRRLSMGNEAALVFVAPTWRITLLWSDLVARCKQEGVEMGPQRTLSPELVVCPIGEHHVLALVSWRILLQRIIQDLTAEGDLSTISDVQQLQGLCSRMDDVAFLPIRSEELTSPIPVRYLQFCQLVNDVVKLAVEESLASFTSKISYGPGIYYHPMLLSGCGCYLQVNSEFWSRLRPTPIWLSVSDAKWKVTQAIKDSLLSLEHEDPPSVIHTETQVLVPLKLSLGVDRPTVLNSLFAQVRRVAALLAGSAGPGHT